jgi:hypothetical protein
VLNKGVWSHEDELSFPLLSESLGKGSFKKPEQFSEEGTVPIKISVVSLDSIFGDQSIDLLRMDIEGAEIEAIKGATKILQNPTIKVVLEWTPEIADRSESDELYDLMVGMGFDLYRITKQGCIKINSADQLHAQEALCRNGQRDIFCFRPHADPNFSPRVV